MSWVSEFLSPSASNLRLPEVGGYTPQNMPGADTAAFGGIGNLSNFNMYPGMLGQAQGITQGLVNNPGAPSWMQGAQYAQGMGQGAANNAFGAGGGLMSMGANIAGTAFDPQQDLYARTMQRITDQARAGQAARGIATTPYGAGLENDAMRNFNIDWGNAQLQRQIAGGAAAGGLFGQGVGMQLQAPGQYYQYSGLPYQTGQTIGQNQMGALSQLGQFGTAGAQLPQQQFTDYMNYLGWGTGAQNAQTAAQLGGFNAALNREKLAADQSSSMWGGIGKTAAAIAPYALAFLSDERVKDDISQVGELYDGLPVYSYRYKGDPATRIGLIAQDVEKVRPDAVHDVGGGLKAVDYGKATELSRGLSALSNWG